MNDQVNPDLSRLDNPRLVEISFTQLSTFDVPLRPGSAQSSQHIATSFQTISAQGEAAKPTSAEVAQQNHLEAAACQPLIPSTQQVPSPSSGSVLGISGWQAAASR